MSSKVPADIRQLVAERASFRCEYCLIPEQFSFAAHEIDHIIARKHGGSSQLDNLAYSCSICNGFKGSDLASYDPVEDQVVALYHPRRDKWNEHFRLDGSRITPLTQKGRATVTLLRLNRPSCLAERELLRVAALLIPPS